jgi:hypothetical protein
VRTVSALNEDYRAALTFTTGTLRQWPALRKWQICPGEDEAHDLVVRSWREAKPVARVLEETRIRHQDKLLTKLIESAQEFLDQQDKRLGLAWAGAVETRGYKSMPVSGQRLYGALHVKAAHPGRYGGPNVLMSHLLAVDFIEALYGRRYSPRAITAAMRHLVDAELVYVVVGTKYGDDLRPARNQIRATIYNLLPAGKNFIKPLCAEGLYEVDGRPRLPVETMDRLIRQRQASPEKGKLYAPVPDADPELLAILNGDDLK